MSIVSRRVIKPANLPNSGKVAKVIRHSAIKGGHMSVYKRKDSSFWWYKITVNGKTYSKSTKLKYTRDNKPLALKMSLDAIQEIRSQRVRISKTWADLASYYQTHSNLGDTDKRIIDWTLKHWGNLNLEELDSFTVNKFLDIYRLKVKAATANRAGNTIRALFNKAYRELQWIDHQPFIKRFKEEKKLFNILSRNDEQKLLLALPKHMKAIVKFALVTGFRKSLICGLTFEMFDGLHHLNIPPSLMKNKQGKRIPLNLDAIEIIRNQNNKKSIGTSKKIFTYKGNPIKNPAGNSWRRVVRNLDLNIRFHDLRATWAVRMLESGAHMQKIAALGCWNSVRMVEYYTRNAVLDVSDIDGYLKDFD